MGPMGAMRVEEGVVGFRVLGDPESWSRAGHRQQAEDARWGGGASWRGAPAAG